MEDGSMSPKVISHSIFHRNLRTSRRSLLTQIGIHDEEVEVLLQVAAVFRHLSPEQVEDGSQQVVTETEVIGALAHRQSSRVTNTSTAPESSQG